MDENKALQELAMALEELGIDPAALAAIAGDEGGKMAAAVTTYKGSGRFQFAEAKQGSAERNVRDYMKGYIAELCQRSR